MFKLSENYCQSPFKNNHTLKIQIRKEYIWIFLLSFFYLVGLVGLSYSHAEKLFLSLTPVILLMSFFLLLAFQLGWSRKSVIIYLFIAISGFLVEVAGVKTGVIFGEYSYGKVLGPKVMETPLLIGINWLLLSVCTYSIISGFKMGVLLKIILSSFLMLAYDVVLEPAAIYTGMWNWEKTSVPVQNYIAWFIISFVFQAILNLGKVSPHNKLAKAVYLIQFFFFILLNIIVLN